jgi:hypothetical protein
MDSICPKRVIAARAADVRELFWDIAAWQRIWSPIDAVEVVYDDGLLQESLMTLGWGGGTTQIRIIRFREPDGNIAFFSPTPPPEMTTHVGRWEFEDRGDACAVTARRDYELRRDPAENDDAFSERRASFRAAFQGRVERILETFQAHYASQPECSVCA